jgi:outer membrane lipoprotein carrier protein
MQRRTFTAALAATLSLHAAASMAADAPTALDRFLEGLHSLRMHFTQSRTDAQGREVDHATGELLVLRPNRLRWDIQPASGADRDAGQLLVVDGRNVWFFDRDLQQVQVKPMDAALSATPAMLLSGDEDVRRNFSVASSGTHDGLAWVRVEPHGNDADFREAQLGFAGNELKRMILKDKLGQTTTFSFDRAERNATVSPNEVTFTPPSGVDVIGNPVK